MASTLRCGLVRPATTKTSQIVQQTTSLFSQLTMSSNTNLVPRVRLFSTTPLRLGPGLPRQGTPLEADGTKSDLPIPTMSSRDPNIPAYPYGERKVYKQSNRGLYGTARIRFGNNVSEKHNVKTPRKWRPNVRRRRMWSEALRCFVQTKVTARVMRTIDKCGGLDNYLLGDKPARKKELGPWGWKLRWRIMQTDMVKERFRLQRIEYGLLPRDMSDTIQMEAEAYADLNSPSYVAEDPESPVDMTQVDEMLESETEFTIGTDEGFMKEQHP